MKPILFEENTTSFSTNGLGRLDLLECTLIEERNGQYELSCVVPVDSVHYADIRLNRIIGVIPGDGINVQGFRIYKIEEPLDGRVTVNARHISYDLSYNVVMPFTAGSAPAALQGLKQNAVEVCPFDFWTDKTTTAKFSVSVPCSIRSRLGGVQGSILDAYGGEYEWDNWTVKLHNHRGQDAGVTLRYGKNITDLKQERNIENVVTGIVPFWAGEEETITLPERVIETEYVDRYPFHRTVPIDFSSDFEEAPTEAQLRNKANSYISNNNLGIPKVSIEVSFLPLWQSEEYKNISPLEKVHLCDTVGVYFERYGIDARAKVVKTEWDVLKERYVKIELGEARSTLAQTIADVNVSIKEQADTTKTELERAIDAATKALTGAKGGYLKFNYNANGEPYEMLIMDEPNEKTAKVVWRYNNAGWGVSTHGINGPYELAATLNDTYGASINASYIVAGILNAALVKTGILQAQQGGNYWNMNTGEFRMLTNYAKIDGKNISSTDYADNAAGTAESNAKNYADSAAASAASSAVSGYDSALDKAKIWGRLTDNGQAQGIVIDHNTGDFYINATYIAGGVLASNDSATNPNFILNMNTGDLRSLRFSLFSTNSAITDAGVIKSLGNLTSGAGYPIYEDGEIAVLKSYTKRRVDISGGILSFCICNNINDTDDAYNSILPIGRILVGEDELGNMSESMSFILDGKNNGRFRFLRDVYVKGTVDCSSIDCASGPVGCKELQVFNTTTFFGTIYMPASTQILLEDEDGIYTYAYNGYIKDENGTRRKVKNGIIMG